MSMRTAGGRRGYQLRIAPCSHADTASQESRIRVKKDAVSIAMQYSYHLYVNLTHVKSKMMLRDFKMTRIVPIGGLA